MSNFLLPKIHCTKNRVTNFRSRGRQQYCLVTEKFTNYGMWYLINTRFLCQSAGLDKHQSLPKRGLTTCPQSAMGVTNSAVNDMLINIDQNRCWFETVSMLLALKTCTRN